jgi:hypothetical protein
MLIPESQPGSIAIALAVIAGLGLLRAVRNVYAIAKGTVRFGGRIQTVRRMGWTLAADVILIYTAARLWSSADGAIENLVTVVFVLMVGAADVAWEMLVEVSRDADP